MQIAGATVYGYLDRRAQAEMLNRARVVFTRSGYTTLMELAELGKRALFVPPRGRASRNTWPASTMSAGMSVRRRSAGSTSGARSCRARRPQRYPARSQLPGQSALSRSVD